MQEKTILGVTLRRRIITTVNGMGRGERISVVFKGTRAYTNGKTIVLPAIRDLAEIPYSTARALIGYAIHEVSHVRFTDFETIIRAIEAGKMKPDALIKKFENAIEDYRIERKISREFPGSASDLEALRNLIHPPLKKLKPGWLTDPRACGPLALTWTGSVLNGFRVKEVQTTLDAFPAPVRALIDNWTLRMTNVASTEEALDLAIAFTKEAMDYADISRQQSQQDSTNNDSQSSPQDNQQDPDQQDGQSAPQQSPDEQDTDDADHGDTDQQDADNGSDGDDSPAENDNIDNGECAAGSDAPEEDQSEQDGDQSEAGTPSSSGEGNQSTDSDAQPGAGDNASSNDSDSSSNGADGAGSDDNGADAGVDDINFGGTSKSSGNGLPNPGGQKGQQDGSIGMNDGMTDEYDDGSPNGSSSEAPSDQPSKGDASSRDQADDVSGDQAGQNADASNTQDQNTPGAGTGDPSLDSDDETARAESSDDCHSDAGRGPSSAEAAEDDADLDGEAEDDQISGDPSDSMGDTLFDQVSQSDGDSAEGSNEDDESDPFKDVLEENAEIDDMLDDLREIISQMPLPEEAPDAIDGEVDPSEVLSNVKKANSIAPDYQSPDPDPNAEKSDDEGGNGASKHHYDDQRFVPVDEADEESNQYEVLRSAAAGVIATTARTIRRLLMAEEQRGILRNKRAGQFDIRNISAIVRNTGTCYKKKWEKPAPKTHLMLLTDFSGSMMCGATDRIDPMANRSTRLSLAMTGALAIEEATRNSQVQTSLYGYTGYSPEVQLCVFKDGRQRQITTRRKIGSYLDVSKGCTPTAEAMIAVADILDHMEEDRRVLVVLTDGDADDMTLCAAVVPVLRRRGIEVVAIGIMKDSVKDWCPDHYVINDIAQLPTALLSIIDPRGHKKLRKAA